MAMMVTTFQLNSVRGSDGVGADDRLRVRRLRLERAVLLISLWIILVSLLPVGVSAVAVRYLCRTLISAHY